MREGVTTILAPNASGLRYRALVNHEMAATTLTEPYITVAERAGCRILVEAPFHGTQVATNEVDAETYRAFNRAVREAV